VPDDVHVPQEHVRRRAVPVQERPACISLSYHHSRG
jgi:hypothetical protein